MQEKQHSRREFVKKVAYMAPAILTLQAAPAYAKAGSVKPGKPVKPVKPKSKDRNDPPKVKMTTNRLR